MGGARTSSAAIQQRRARLLSALRNYKCDAAAGDRTRNVEKAAVRRGSDNANSSRRNREGQERTQRADNGTVPRLAAGRYRTLCVRSCDGYFFPISGVSNRADFTRDQKNCQAMCPAGDAQLYYHDVNDEESEDMVAVTTGRPYLDLPAAFDYRSLSSSRPGCTCQPNGGKRPPMSVRAAKTIRSSKLPVPAILPLIRPDPHAAPEIIANIEGGLNKNSIMKLFAETGETTQGSVRVVGPVFLPDPKGAIDLQARVLKTSR
ncbi:DUF2865 domain-containing protein [Limoniibacter endophyticus]|uniref:DUF2865 domain-containing protein n=1 Tax=Limoniibacter endophyticus TaxID=1565040 RepID=UPI003614F479